MPLGLLQLVGGDHILVMGAKVCGELRPLDLWTHLVYLCLIHHGEQINGEYAPWTRQVFSCRRSNGVHVGVVSVIQYHNSQGESYARMLVGESRPRREIASDRVGACTDEDNMVSYAT
jgi:hypothetical protein